MASFATDYYCSMVRRIPSRCMILIDAGPPLLLYVTCFLLLLLANSAGVTHWKVHEGTILPVEPQPHNSADSIASSNYLSDPEFAVLTRNSKSAKGGYQMCPPQAAATNGQANQQQVGGTCRDFQRVAPRKPDGSNPMWVWLTAGQFFILVLLCIVDMYARVWGFSCV